MSTIDPDLLPPYAGTRGAWLLYEAIDHLWPWSWRGFRRQKLLLLAGLLLALLMTAVWVLAALGRVPAGTLIACWAGWSAVEIAIRMQSKPYVKEGPWWQRHYRPASAMDMLSYVSFKNLLLGAALFLSLKALGLLVL